MTTQDNKSWEDELAKIYFGAGHLTENETYERLKSFIHSTLNKERDELIKKVEGMETSKERENVLGGESIEGKNRRIGYNQAIYDILTILKEDGKN